MRAILCLFLIGLAVASAAVFRDDGRPGCKTVDEMSRPWRHHLEPTKFWLCTQLGAAALPVKCPESTAFSEQALTCISWEDWEWTAPRQPPSHAD